MTCLRRIDFFLSGWTSLVFGSLVYRVLPTQSIETIDDLPDAHLRVQSSKVFSKDIHRGISPSSHLLLFIANCPDKEGQRGQPSGMMKSQSIFTIFFAYWYYIGYPSGMSDWKDSAFKNLLNLLFNQLLHQKVHVFMIPCQNTNLLKERTTSWNRSIPYALISA